MGFERYEERNRQTDRPAQLIIRPDYGMAYLTVGAVDEYLTRHGSVADSIAYYVDREESTLGIAVGDDGPHAFSVSPKSGGASISIGGTLAKSFDVDTDDIDESWALPIEPADAESVDIQVDLSGIVEAVTGAVHCPECGQRCETEAGLTNHIKHTHETNPKQLLKEMDPEDIGGAAPDGDDSWQDYSARAGGDE